MRCTSYCIASNFTFSQLHEDFLQKHPNEDLKKYREVLHISSRENDKDIFIFTYGTVTFWGFTQEEEKNFLSLLSPYEQDSLEKIEVEESNYNFAQDTHIGRENISLESPDSMIKLAISHGLSQSIKLTVFEELSETTIQKTRSYPEELATNGRIAISKTKASKIMGQLMLQRNSINLHTEILDTPEFFWEYPELESYYLKTAGAFEISNRVDILNKRLDIIKETFELLSNELNHQHSSFLEWIIIILILIEVILGVLQWIGF